LVAVVGVEPVAVAPPVVGEPAGLADAPSIVAFSSLNGIFRFRETCSAAMN